MEQAIYAICNDNSLEIVTEEESGIQKNTTMVPHPRYEGIAFAINEHNEATHLVIFYHGKENPEQPPMETMTDEKIIQKFKDFANQASSHFAADYGEQELGRQAMMIALDIFDDYPRLQPAMREAAKGELWSLSKERPEKED